MFTDTSDTDVAAAFRVLGLPPGAPLEDVRAAYKRLALRCHPDKPGGSLEAFNRVHTAFLAASRPRRLVTVNGGAMMQWFFAAYAAIASGQCRADDVHVNVHVTLEDIYMARVKKVVVGVWRHDDTAGGHAAWGKEGGEGAAASWVRRQQAVLVSLRTRQDPYVFERAGDDPRISWLGFLRAVKRTPDAGRSDLVVHLVVEPHPVYRIDDVYSAYDLHADVDVSVLDFYYGRTLELPFLDPEASPMVVHYGDGKRVHVEHGFGLPMPSGERGDLYVYFNMQMPRLDAAHLSRPEVSEALRLVFGPHAE